MHDQYNSIAATILVLERSATVYGMASVGNLVAGHLRTGNLRFTYIGGCCDQRTCMQEKKRHAPWFDDKTCNPKVTVGCCSTTGELQMATGAQLGTQPSKTTMGRFKRRNTLETPHIETSWIRHCEPPIILSEVDNLIRSQMKVYCTATDTVRAWMRGDGYIALSYVWTQYSATDLQRAMHDISTCTGIQLFWCDKWCIDQSDEAIKLAQLPLMRLIYASAMATVTLMEDVVARSNIAPVWNNCGVYDLEEHRTKNEEMARCIRDHEWHQRLWTYQEERTASTLVIKTDSEYMLAEYVHSLSRVAPGTGCLMFNGRVKYDGTNQPGTTATVFDGCANTAYLRGLMRETRAVQHRDDLLRLMASTTARKCHNIHDRIYALISLVEKGETFWTNYHEHWTHTLVRAANSGLLDGRLLLSEEGCKDEGACWAPDLSSHINRYKDEKAEAVSLSMLGNSVVYRAMVTDLQGLSPLE